MKKILVATKARGFLITLFQYKFDEISFAYNESKVYEINSKLKLQLSKIVKSKLSDYLGLIQRIKVTNDDYNIMFSYNRFLKTNKDYIIYLENPLALVHYSTKRPYTLISRYKLKRWFKDPHLKEIVCLSKACYETIKNIYDIPSEVKIDQIYPLIEKIRGYNKEHISEKTNNNELKCLFISSNFKLKGGEDIIETFEKLRRFGLNNVKLTIITPIDSLDDKTMKRIDGNGNVELFDFKFDRQQLIEIYKNSNVLLNPTRQDSFPLVILEAMKAGNVIISTDLYAIKEMVEDRFNGFLIEPRYRFFREDNMPNEHVWNNRDETIYSNYTDERVINFMFEKICYLEENRTVLREMSLNSYNKANKGEFSEVVISSKWEEKLLRSGG